MNRVLTIIGPLWRLCTAYTVQVGRWCGVWTPNPRFLSSILSRPAAFRQVVERLGPGLQLRLHGFESRPAFQHDVVVTPTQGPRTGAYRPAPG